MKIKDSTIILLLFFTWFLIACGVLGAENEIKRMEDQIAQVCGTQDYLLSNTKQIAEKNAEQDQRLSDIERKDRVQDIRLDLHHEELEENAQRFDDLLHEVNAFEEAVESLTPVHITLPTTWTGRRLTRSAGVVNGPSGRETYYNMDMSFCVSRMRSKGYSAEEYPYWIRSDGAKMLGQYVMVAANFRIRPLGTIIETSIGWGIVVDTGGFVKNYPTGLDVATNW